MTTETLDKATSGQLQKLTQTATKKPAARRPSAETKRAGSSPSNFADRNKRELTPNLAETHKLLTAVQFGDRAALLVRKRMSFTETGPLPATKALGLLEQYDSAINNYVTAVDALCKSVGIDRVKQSKPVTRKTHNKISASK